MAIIEQASFSVSGESFSPTLAEKTLRIVFQFKIEKGETWKRTGNVSRFGYGLYHGSRNVNDLLSLLEQDMPAFRQLGCDDFILTIDVTHDGQCNFDLKHNVLEKISKLHLDLNISIHEDKALIDKMASLP